MAEMEEVMNRIARALNKYMMEKKKKKSACFSLAGKQGPDASLPFCLS